MPSEQVFIKKGHEFIPISPTDGWSGFPMDGIWLVRKDFSRNSAACIVRIDELPTPYDFPSYSRMALMRDELAGCICKTWGCGSISAADLADAVLKFLAGNTKKFEL